MSRRKHVKQMSKREKDYLRETIDGLQNLYITRHCNERIDLKVMTPEEVLRSVRHGNIIECHNNVSNDIRILVRHDRDHPLSICTVVSLKNEAIVTSYPNPKSDRHFTLDWSQYRWRVDLESEIKRFMYKKGSNKLSLR